MDFRSRVDRELLPGLDVMAALGFPTSPDAVAQTRRNYDAIMVAAATQFPPDEGVTESDHPVPERDGVSIRLYRPKGADETLPAMYWIHGGGMVIGSVAGDDLYCRRLVHDLGIAVVSVEYRLAPEHPFPTPVEDCYAGLVHAVEIAAELGIDPSRVVLGGASAGGGLAAGTALLARDRGGPALRYQYLMYPMLDDRNTTSSSQEFAGIVAWGREHNVNGWACYLGGATEVSSYAAANRATDLAGLPPTLVQVGELEVVRDEAIDYATRLMQAGVPTELHVYPGAYHGWDAFTPGAGVTERAREDRNTALRRAVRRDVMSRG